MIRIKNYLKEKAPDLVFAQAVNLLTKDIRIKRFENDWLISHDGIELRSPSAKHYGVHKKIFEERFESVFKIDKKDTVMDVGASIGETTVCFAEKCKHVVAVEPEPNNVRCLAYNLKNYSHTIIEKAAWNKNEIIKFYIDSHVTGHSLLNNYCTTDSNIGCIEVEADTLNNIAQLYGEKINFLKIDVQGAELPCLEGAEELLDTTEKIVIETHVLKSGSTAPDVIKFLVERDFQYKSVKHWYAPDNTYFEIVHAWK